MDPKTHTVWLMLASLVGFAAGYIFTNSTEFGLCICNSDACNPACLNFYERLGDPLYYGMGALALVFLILLFVPRAFPAWKKFAIWFVPLAALIFIFYPTPKSGDLFSPDPETIFRWLSSAYVLVSVALIGVSVVKKR